MFIRGIVFKESLMGSHRFFQNRDCEYFPCHQGADNESFSCLFCYCPLYALGDQCGGAFTYTQQGIKDCSKCLKPHLKENYEHIIEKMQDIIELAKKRDEP